MEILPPAKDQRVCPSQYFGQTLFFWQIKVQFARKIDNTNHGVNNAHVLAVFIDGAVFNEKVPPSL